MKIGEIIRKEREKQGLSKYMLAKKSGVTETAVRYWEAGKRGITVESADKVLKALGIAVKIGSDISPTAGRKEKKCTAI